MKKAIFFILAIFTYVGGFAQQQPVVAVAPFDAISGISATDANMITRVFFIRLGNTNRVRLVDRNVVDRVLREHNFQAGDWSNQQKTAELGTALNADWIVRGELEKFGSNILVTMQFYDIRTFEFKGGSDVLIANAEAAYNNMDPIVNKLVETIEANPVSVVYNIGDRGPGGGIIFLAENGVYKECSLEIGSFNWNDAIRAASNHRGGGFTDWRLPTIGELSLMYNNLKRKNVGGFSNERYWSSSENEYSSNQARFLNFDSGSGDPIGLPSYLKTSRHLVRAIRQF
jgi:TolB-like protein